MNKIFRVLGRKGNTTVPFAIRIKSRFKPGDVISYEIKQVYWLNIKKRVFNSKMG